MMFASGCAASWTVLAASLTSHSDRSRPPVIDSRIAFAPSSVVSSSGEDVACAAASTRALVARAHADAEQRVAGVGHDRAHVGEVEVDQARERDQVRDALDALAQHVVGDAERLDHRRLLVEHRQQRLFGTTISVSTSSASAWMPGLGGLQPARALEAERLGDDADGQRAELLRDPRHDGRRAGAGAAALAGRDEDHVRALEQGLDAVVVLHRGARGRARDRARAEPARDVGADLQRHVRAPTAAATARRC